MTLELTVSPGELRPLFEVGLEPPRDVERKGLAVRGAVRTLRNKRNTVQLGVSDPVPLLERWPTDARLAEEIEAQRHRFDFSCIRLGLSFVPDRGCRFMWGRLVAELAARGSVAELGPPVAFDLFPREIAEKRTFKRSYSVTPKLTLAFAEVGASATTEQEAIRYEPRLTAAGLLTDVPTWTFDALDRSGLVGSKELFLVLKRERGSGIEARFRISAEVTTLLGRIPLRRYTEPDVVERTYVIT
jgi:hypothetical protein